MRLGDWEREDGRVGGCENTIYMYTGVAWWPILSTCIQGLLGGQVVKALDYRSRGPRFQPHTDSNKDFFHLGVYSATHKK